MGKTNLYACPSPGCNVLRERPSDLSEHVNSEHPGGWDDPDWPDPEVDDD